MPTIVVKQNQENGKKYRRQEKAVTKTRFQRQIKNAQIKLHHTNQHKNQNIKQPKSMVTRRRCC